MLDFLDNNLERELINLSQELDLKILKSLAEKEVTVQNVATSRREKAKADAKWMKQVRVYSISSSLRCLDLI